MLLDTSGLLCLMDLDDERHPEAQTCFDAAPDKITHSYVLAEFVTLANVRGHNRASALAFLADLQDSVEVEVVYIDRELHRTALDLLRQRTDKDWSLADAASFELMRRRNLTEALTTDRHLEQAGFVRLLPS